jgi:hypothetical protein
MTKPTRGGYVDFIRNVMLIDTTILPDDSIWIDRSYNVAYNRTNKAIARFPNYDPTQPSPYALAIYNLGGDRLINYAQDLPGAAVIEGSNPALPYFKYMRSTLKLNTFVGGTVQSSSDNGTSVSLTVPKAMEGLTMQDLQNMKTPWGQAYMGIIQEYGPAGWGIS